MLEQVAELVGLDDAQVDRQPAVRAAARRRSPRRCRDGLDDVELGERRRAARAGSDAVAMMSRSLTLSAAAARAAGELDALARRVARAAPRRCSAMPSALGSRKRGAGFSAMPASNAASTGSSNFGPKPRTSRSCSPSAASRSASSESMPSSSKSLRARLGPRPGQARHVDQAGRELRAQLLERRDRPRLEQRVDLLLERLADAGQRRDRALARQRRRPERGASRTALAALR